MEIMMIVPVESYIDCIKKKDWMYIIVLAVTRALFEDNVQVLVIFYNIRIYRFL